MKGLSAGAALRSALLTAFFVAALAWIGDARRDKNLPRSAAFSGGVEVPTPRMEPVPALPPPPEAPPTEPLPQALDRTLRRGLLAADRRDVAEALRARDQLAARAPNDARVARLDAALVLRFRPVAAEHLLAGRCSEAQVLYRALAARGLGERLEDLFGDNRCPLPR